MKIFLLSLLILLSFTGQAYACRFFKDASEKNIIAIIDKAEFIGIVEVIKRDDIKNDKEHYSLVTYKVIVPYKGKFKAGDEIVSNDREVNSCQRGHPKAGKIVEEMFFASGKNIRNAEQQEYSLMEEIRKRLYDRDFSLKGMEDAQAECVKAGNIWGVVQGWQNEIRCRYPTKDSEKICSDAAECESGCFAMKEELGADKERLLWEKRFYKDFIADSKEARDRYESVKNYIVAAKGKCTAWKNEKTCGYVVEQGFVKEAYKCVGE